MEAGERSCVAPTAMRATKPDYRTPYCLSCYAPLGELSAPSTRCPSCGAANLTVDLRRLWTREPKVRRVEALLKGLIVVVLGTLSAVMLLYPGTGTSGPGHGMAAGAPILLGVLLWDAASISQRDSLFRGSLIWPIVGGLVLGPATLIFLSMPSPAWVRPACALVVVCCLAGLASPLTRKRWRCWREARIKESQARLATA